MIHDEAAAELVVPTLEKSKLIYPSGLTSSLSGLQSELSIYVYVVCYGILWRLTELKRGTPMRRLLLAAAIGLVSSTPAAARDGSPYLGIDAGLLFARDGDLDIIEPGGTNNDADIEYKRGIDADLVAGYDFGLLRAEAELGYKRAKHDRYTASDDFRVDANGKTSALSLMGNLLFDFGSADGLSVFAGGGAGLARSRVRLSYDDDGDVLSETARDTRLAWQILAGVRYAISSHADIGLKYRYFRTKLKDDNFVDDVTGGTDALRTDFRSHSLLAALTFNFGAAEAPAPPPAPPPPPPPEPAPVPATQTCPDGSVVLATDTCPLPPPPPPPPSPAPERG